MASPRDGGLEAEFVSGIQSHGLHSAHGMPVLTASSQGR